MPFRRLFTLIINPSCISRAPCGAKEENQDGLC